MTDKEFFDNLKSVNDIFEMLSTYEYEEILITAASILNADITKLDTYPMGGYIKNKSAAAYRFTINELKKNKKHYLSIYNKLADDKSRICFTRLIQYRLLPDVSFLKYAFDSENHQYFDKDIIKCSNDEIFADCGGFIDDTTEDYIAHYPEYKKIYIYEPEASNIIKCKDNLVGYDNIVIRNCGVGEKNNMLYISNEASASSFLGLNESCTDKTQIEVVSLDEDIKEPVTFIKMDVKGFEIPAIIGAKNHIKNDKPKLAICTYHIMSDMWEIPELILNINPDYKLYFRHYRDDFNWETVVYAVNQDY